MLAIVEAARRGVDPEGSAKRLHLFWGPLAHSPFIANRRGAVYTQTDARPCERSGVHPYGRTGVRLLVRLPQVRQVAIDRFPDDFAHV